MDNTIARFVKDYHVRLIQRSSIIPGAGDATNARMVALEAVTGPFPVRVSLWLVSAPDSVEGILTLMTSYAELLCRPDHDAAYTDASDDIQLTARRAFVYLYGWLGEPVFARLIDAYRAGRDAPGSAPRGGEV